MKTFVMYLCYTAVVVIGTIQPVVSQHRTLQRWQGIDEHTLDDSTAKALEHWRTDSLGCLKLRTWKDAVTLVEYFHLKESTKDSILMILGTPNHIVDAPEISTWSYGIDTFCESGESSESMLVEIQRKTNKSIKIRFAIH